jgi:hypothetical protein
VIGDVLLFFLGNDEVAQKQAPAGAFKIETRAAALPIIDVVSDLCARRVGQYA